MLTNYLSAEPLTKFILIKDGLNERGKPFLDYLIKSPARRKPNKDYNYHYFVYEGIYNRTVKEFDHVNVQIKFYDCVSNLNGWKNRISKETLDKAKSDPYFCICPCPDYKEDLFSNFCDSTCNQDDIKQESSVIVVIDSLVHMIYDYGFHMVYSMLNKLKNNPNIVEVIAVLHEDLLEDSNVACYLDHLSTLNFRAETSFGRICYTYKKPGGKIITQIEEYEMLNGSLVTRPIKKLDVQSLIRSSLSEIQPDTLTTFKISLEDNEKQARANLTLPYLPKQEESEAEIIYNLDEQDDWDVEDPDDDLDI